MNVQKQVNELIKRYEEGHCSKVEEDLVESILFYEENKTTINHSFNPYYKEELWKKLEQKTRADYSYKRLWYYLVSAAVLCILSFGGYFYTRLYVSSIDSEQQISIKDDIKPGGNKAILTLANGKKIELDNSKPGIIVQTGSINYADESQLNVVQNINTDKTELFELTTPKGGQYQITLPDGSKVWLNADSKLRYPGQFERETRTVYLDGEAYFEVNEQKLKSSNGTTLNVKQPFIVKTRQQQVQVLGTRFNINSYETEIRTTLASGSLKVGNNDGNAVLLKPHEQAINTGTQLHKTSINTDKELAWKLGKFSFDNKNFSSIMNEIGRWYNIEIIYKGKIPQSELIGDAFRNQNISLILRLLDADNIKHQLDIHKRTLTIY
ncbi:FecR family protein [Sphingobacterium tabacisoli]|uniref:FecR family protein n=1 Tax=Sphingobacterium tabacisoli TaxID=2044855 RepID=A0ABW5L8T6_9SPHI|nr:FecR family protein [Sphingobacterium tabacisoli]